MVRVAVRRKQVAYARQRGLSCRRACSLLSVARSTLTYKSKKDEADAPIIERMRALSRQYPRYGYRRIHVFLEREGFVMGPERAHRLWRKAELQVPRKRRRRRVAATRPRPSPPSRVGEVWSCDFMFDYCANGQRLKCLTVVDEFTRESLAIEVAGSIRSGRVIEVLSRLISVHGAPRHLRCDNGPEFIALALLRWLTEAGIETAYIAPGKPWQNGMGESFNGSLRAECLDLEWFRNRKEAKVIIEKWRRHYNAVRPHSSLNNLTPLEFKKRLLQSSNSAEATLK